MENPFALIHERLTSIENMLREIRGERTEPDELLTTAQAVKLIKVSKVSLYNWRKRGVIEAVRFGKSVRFRKSDLLKLKNGA